MKSKLKEKLSTSKSKNKKRPLTLDEEIECFGRPTHNKHTSKKYEHVTAAMDKLSKVLLRYHRIYGHNVKFLKVNFKNENEILAGYKHLLGDFLDDILTDVVKIVSQDIKKNDVLPPQFFIINEGKAVLNIREEAAKTMLKKYGKGEWDIKSEAIDEMKIKLSQLYLTILKNKKNRKAK